ncbi:MAG: hypothetical protein AAGF11_49020 [Myxococcota bacterium]
MSESTGRMGATGGTGGTESTSGREISGGSTGPVVASAGSLACLAGTWVIDDLSTYFRRIIRKQAHGRSVRYIGSTGRYTLRFDGSKIHGEARHLRLRYAARLADRDVRYTVDIHGSFESTVRMDGRDTLQVMPTTRSTMRVREIARFEGGKIQNRRPKLPVEGRYELDCGAAALELRPIEGGKTREAIRFIRP